MLGWHYLSNASCLIRPRLFYACFVVSRIAILCYIICHYWRNTVFRQVVLDKWFPLITITWFPLQYTDSYRNTSVYENICLRALAVQCSGRNCSPPPDLMLWKLIVPHAFSLECFLLFVSQTPDDVLCLSHGVQWQRFIIAIRKGVPFQYKEFYCDTGVCKQNTRPTR